jgi:hypothetical protein
MVSPPASPPSGFAYHKVRLLSGTKPPSGEIMRDFASQTFHGFPFLLGPGPHFTFVSMIFIHSYTNTNTAFLPHLVVQMRCSRSLFLFLFLSRTTGNEKRIWWWPAWLKHAVLSDKFVNQEKWCVNGDVRKFTRTEKLQTHRDGAIYKTNGTLKPIVTHPVQCDVLYENSFLQTFKQFTFIPVLILSGLCFYLTVKTLLSKHFCTYISV